MSTPTGAGAEPNRDDHVFITRLDPSPGPGLTLAVKDCIDVAGTVTTAGSPVVAESADAATDDAACLRGARQAGARIVGKTNLHELCFGATGLNEHYGTPRSPLDPKRIPGGSSSGSAVAVATGQATVALGTDTAGSIRNPAACCGVVGLKTTWGRIPVNGTRPLAPSLDTIGPLAADVAGVVVGMSLLEPGFTSQVVTEGRAVRLGRLRLPGVDPRIDQAIDAALDATGCSRHDVELPGWQRAHEDGRILMFAEALEVNEDLVAHHRNRLGADVVDRFDQAAQIGPDVCAAARARQAAWRAELAVPFEVADAIVLVGYPTFPPSLDAADTASNGAAVAISFAGFPALCLPVPTVDGPPTVTGSCFPASLQLVGLAGSEERLVGLGVMIERSVAEVDRV